ncbi:hypothetical protein L0Y97_15435 [Burkholderia multivorans]|uniref:hypothetical protein n=1 Tax=Burkholderia multivorans TaxID=87883 RepID=UPI000D00CE5D|nr:hypothetical protein [Burkholderia multivorans]MCO1360353.1 hypothetical protein [Burkholderia multivorans]MCO1402959.1 hypothetical protein [Burkholderia multivorans]MCO1420119.1 hypothetical protein [Burkholderia multivorans]PRD91781.1 hypothetical protein C6P76_01350 [Burkholderia multivorans]UQO78519.1 hypothetical protein L0Z12_05665 [Burkholderia multivorans]
MHKATTMPELEACGWFVRTKRTDVDPSGLLVADCSAANERGSMLATLFAAAPDMADILEIIAADADAGTIMLTSGVRLAIDAALIKAGRKKAPEPVRHFTINGDMR